MQIARYSCYYFSLPRLFDQKTIPLDHVSNASTQVLKKTIQFSTIGRAGSSWLRFISRSASVLPKRHDGSHSLYGPGYSRFPRPYPKMDIVWHRQIASKLAVCRRYLDFS
jgi:hypothetical protein